MYKYFPQAIFILSISIATLSSCNKEKSAPVLGDYNTTYMIVQYPALDTSIISNERISVSYFTKGEIKVEDYLSYQSYHILYQSNLENYYTGGDVNTNTSWSLQYFPEQDSIDYRWSQLDAQGSSVMKFWRGTREK